MVCVKILISAGDTFHFIKTKRLRCHMPYQVISFWLSKQRRVAVVGGEPTIETATEMRADHQMRRKALGHLPTPSAGNRDKPTPVVFGPVCAVSAAIAPSQFSVRTERHLNLEEETKEVKCELTTPAIHLKSKSKPGAKLTRNVPCPFFLSNRYLSTAF